MTVYLIGGPPKCGKTTLAKALSKKLSIPWISADTLQNIVWAYMSKTERKSAFPHVELKGVTNDETYSKNKPQEIVQAYIKQGKTTYAAIRIVTETYLTDQDDIIIEGYQVTPEIVNKIIRKFGSKNIKPVFLIKTDIDKFVQDIHKSNTPNDWIIRKTKLESTYYKIAAMIFSYSKYFEKSAGKYGLPVLNMDDKFLLRIKEVIKNITSE
jgi:2-phosphoglycerate kinase